MPANNALHRTGRAMRMAFVVAAALMSTGAFAEDLDLQRAKALGAYIDSYAGEAGLLATECQALKKGPLKASLALLDEERPFLSDSEYQEFKGDLEGSEHQKQMTRMDETLKSGIAAATKAGASHEKACSMVVGAMEDQIKQQKGAWDAIKRKR